LGVGVGRLASATAVAGFASPEPSNASPITVGSTPSIKRPGVIVGKGIAVGGTLIGWVGWQATNQTRMKEIPYNRRRSIMQKV
jgi:hypothetical protein